MSTCSIYKVPVLLGTGSITNGGNITSYTGVDIPVGKNIKIMITSSTDDGKEYSARIITSAAGGATLTPYPANPFAT